jgi:hypothetical protein
MTALIIRKIIFTVLWAFVFWIGSAVLLGLGSGLFFARQSAQGLNPAANTALINNIGTAWAVVPMVAGLIGLILGVVGWLPGTRNRLA